MTVLRREPPPSKGSSPPDQGPSVAEHRRGLSNRASIARRSPAASGWHIVLPVIGLRRLEHMRQRQGSPDEPDEFPGDRHRRHRAPLAVSDERPVPPMEPLLRVTRGAPASRGCLPDGPSPGLSTGDLMSPPVACRMPLVAPPCGTRRDSGLCPFASPSTLRRLGLPPPSRGPSPLPAGVPVVCGHKALPSAPGFGYNPHVNGIPSFECVLGQGSTVKLVGDAGGSTSLTWKGHVPVKPT